MAGPLTTPDAGTPAGAVPALPYRTRAAARVGLGVAGASRRLGRGGGSVIGGRAILALEPRALSRLAVGREIALVSGTNGKTTTTSLLAAALGVAGPVVTNVLGANLPPGLAAALAAGRSGERAALEVDEAWLERVVDATAPRAVGLLNLSRDQLDRNNEVRTVAGRWQQAFAGRGGLTVVANADDPLVVWGALRAPAVRWVGAGQPWTEDARGCPACGGRIGFAVEGDAAAGQGWSCRDCEFSRPDLDVAVVGETVDGLGPTPLRLALQLPGRANRANAAMALTVASVLGAEPALAAEALSGLAEVVGRYAVVRAGSVSARLLLAKNPAGWLEVFDFLAPAPSPVVIAINARIADGRDPSWLWDVPFERLAGRLVVATGERSRDLAVRLRYAGVDHVREPDLVAAVAAAGVPGAGVAGAGGPAVDVVANYTSFQQLRARLG